MSTVAAVKIYDNTGVRVARVLVPAPISTVKVGISGPKGDKGDKGDPGEALNPFIPVGFQFSNVTERVIYTFESAGKVVGLKIHVETPYNGANSSIAVGTGAEPELLAAFTDSDASQAAEFGISCYEEFAEGDEIIITNNPGAGASQGAGQVILEVVLGE